MPAPEPLAQAHQRDLAIQLISFEYFQALTSSVVAAEAATEGQEKTAVANEERDAGA